MIRFCLCLGLSLWNIHCAVQRASAPLESAPINAYHVPPLAADFPIDSVGLTHLLRGLYFLQHEQGAAAVPYFRLAQIYDQTSPFLYEKLSLAWTAAGEAAYAQAVLKYGIEKNPLDPWLNLLAGEWARGARTYEVAAPHLRRAYEGEATQALSVASYVDSLLWIRDIKTVRNVVDDFLQSKFAHVDSLVRLACVLEDHGELSLALTVWTRVRSLDPSLKEAAFGETRIEVLAGHPQRAAETLVNLLPFYPEDSQLYVVIAGLFFRAHRDEARAYRAEALRLAAADDEVMALLALGDIAEGNREVGRALLEGILDRSPERADVRGYLAELALNESDPQRCLRLVGDHVDLGRLRAACWVATGISEHTVRELSEFLQNEKSPESFVLELVRLIGVRFKYGECVRLLTDLQRRFARQSDSQLWLLAQALLADLFGLDEPVQNYLQQVTVDDSSPAELQLRVADLRARHGFLPQAIETLESLLEQAPEDPSRLNALGFTLVEAGDRLFEAEIYLRRAYRLAPDDGFIVDSFGWLLFEKGQFAAANILLQRAANLLPNDPEILYHLGQSYAALKDVSNALRSFSLALRHYPSTSLKQKIKKQQLFLQTASKKGTSQ